MSKVKNAFMEWAEENAADLGHTVMSEQFVQFMEDLDERVPLKPVVYQLFMPTGTGMYRQTVMYNREPDLDEVKKAELVLRNGVAVKNNQGPAQ